MNFYQQKLTEKKEKHSFSGSDGSKVNVKDQGLKKRTLAVKPSKNFKRKQPL